VGEQCTDKDIFLELTNRSLSLIEQNYHEPMTIYSTNHMTSVNSSSSGTTANNNNTNEHDVIVIIITTRKSLMVW
jgi:hypothetical protein